MEIGKKLKKQRKRERIKKNNNRKEGKILMRKKE